MMMSSAPPQPPPGYLPVSNWRVWDFVLAFVAGIFGSIVATAIVFAIGVDPFDPIPFSLIFAAQAAASLLYVWWRSRVRGSGSLAADVGLIIHGKDWWGVPVGMVLQVAIALLTAPLVVLLFPDGPPEQGVSSVAASSETLLEQLIVVAAVAVAAPIVEEVVFRGVLLSVLRRHMGAAWSVVVSAAVFAAVHLVDPNAIAVVPGLFLLGIALGWAALRRGDLSLAIALHSGINLLAAISLLWGPELLEWSEQQIEQLEAVLSFLV
jgi:membrane protease YdiL (CAAX protease family)